MVGDLIKELRKKHKMTQQDLAAKLGVAPTAVSSWERNANRPLMDKIAIIADLFNVPISRFFETSEFIKSDLSDIQLLPIVGRIACGEGGIAYEDIEGYEPTPREWLNGGEYFYLKAKGDSMTGARIFEGDLLLIRKQEEVLDGEIAAVLIDEVAVLKRVYKRGETLVLQSENPSYAPIVCEAGNCYNVKIIGKLKRVTIRF